MAQGGSKPPFCSKCGRNYLGIFRESSNVCSKCGFTRHFMQYCPKNNKGNGSGGNRAQSSSVAPPHKFSPREANFVTSEGTNPLYGINNSQEQEDSPDVVTSMI